LEYFNDLNDNFKKMLLDEYIEIYEKLDGTALIVKDGKFYKRDGKTELDLVNRIVSILYNDAIKYLSKFNIKNARFEIFSPFATYTIPINLPLNGIVLLEYEGCNTYEKLKAKAAELFVSCVPLVFSGFLNNTQKEYLLECKYVNKKVLSRLFNFYQFKGINEIEGIVISQKQNKYKIFSQEFVYREKLEKNEQHDLYYDYIAKHVKQLPINIPSGYVYSETNYISLILESIYNYLPILINNVPEEILQLNLNDKSYMNYTYIPIKLYMYIKCSRFIKIFTQHCLLNYNNYKKRVSKRYNKEYINIINNKIKLLTNEG